MKNGWKKDYVLSVVKKPLLTQELIEDMSNAIIIGRRPMSASEKTTTTGVKKRGFGSMDPEKQRRIASKGGKAAHEKGHAHEWNSEEAAIAGALGGKNSWFRREPK